MPAPHIIRLRGPWELQVIAHYFADEKKVSGTKNAKRFLTPFSETSRRVAVPGDWAEALGADFRGAVRYTRRFNAPTNLDSDERVWLACDGVDPFGEAWLNDQPLFTFAVGEPAACDITPLLRPHNVLVIEVKLAPEDTPSNPTRPAGRQGAPGGLIGEVRLEIRREP